MTKGESSEDRNGYVRWSQLIGLIVTLVTVLVGAYAGLEQWTWQAHSAQPHSNSVHRDIYIHDRNQLDNRLDRNFTRIDKSLERLEDKVDTLLDRKP